MDLNTYIAALQAADIRDDEAFRSLLNQGMECLGLFDKDIAHEFNVSRPTVTRWRNGTNAPHPLMRRPVYDRLQQRAQALRRRTGYGLSGHSGHAALAARGR